MNDNDKAFKAMEQVKTIRFIGKDLAIIVKTGRMITVLRSKKTVNMKIN